MEEIKANLGKVEDNLKFMQNENYHKPDIFKQLRYSAKKIAEIAIDSFSEKALSKALKISESIANFVNYMDDFKIMDADNKSLNTD